MEVDQFDPSATAFYPKFQTGQQVIANDEEYWQWRVRWSYQQTCWQYKVHYYGWSTEYDTWKNVT